jgi:Fe2+/Zn2+ uptake regulation proteins
MSKVIEPRFQAAAEQLRAAGLRTTRQRLVLAEILFGRGHRHVTAESLFNEAAGHGAKLSLATVYNCLHQFTAAGLLRMVTVDAGRAYFDTNLSPHHHFYYEKTGELARYSGIGYCGRPAAAGAGRRQDRAGGCHRPVAGLMTRARNLPVISDPRLN